jgi:hypothetical protein
LKARDRMPVDEIDDVDLRGHWRFLPRIFCCSLACDDWRVTPMAIILDLSCSAKAEHPVFSPYEALLSPIPILFGYWIIRLRG